MLMSEKHANRISHLTALVSNMLRGYDIEDQVRRIADKESYIMLEDFAASLQDVLESNRIHDELVVEPSFEDAVIDDIEAAEDVALSMLDAQTQQEVIQEYWSSKLD